MRKIIPTFLFIFASVLWTGENAQPTGKYAQSAFTDFFIQKAHASYLDNCSKNFGISADNMYLTSLSVLNSLGYEIKETQSKSGYIIFQTGAKDYIMMITALSPVTSNIKILPVNSVFSNGTAVQQIIFKELDINKLNILKKQG